MVFGVDEDRIVRTSCHASFAPYANRFIKVNDAIGPLEHCGGRTSCDAGSMRALIATRHLMCSSSVWKLAYIDVLDVGASNRERNFIFGLARRRARMTANATRVVDYLGPLNGLRLLWIDW